MKIKEAEIIELMLSEKSREKGVRLMMDAYQSRLYWHIRRIVVDHDLAQDVLQDTFIKAYQNFHQFKQDSQLYTWLYRIATNESLQQLNKLKRMQKTDEDPEYHLQNLMADNVSAEAEEIQVLLQKAIHSLPEKQKLVFNMRYYDDLPYEEISKILDMSVGTLKTNYHYAKQKVEDYIKANYTE
ncbi:MAG: sigma-70 family RNA polymerase sigma factor [Weeksellaceae bacterium]|uniref:RNA polymerase sigma factor n=1 Tax=Kaistella soli TaxID=2849654 RepID=UPI001C265400|nr:sigma-70 family RNA polymerase sigma factor [Kaistella soli]MBU4538861.1 sigma-70 family RNA polymerase sigma factor [Bacteroidota bacterium]MBU8883781.1 sigma-70 family RNA polymerase sigma factor [Kaistella soli]MCG2779948.1 sigma-70 family RNA polymerase sigma factor [Weeksellaceae bacterium]